MNVCVSCTIIGSGISKETENQTHTEQMSDALISLLNPLNETIRAWIQENLAI